VTASKARARILVLITSLLVGLLAALPPSRADTEDDLAAAKKRYAQVQAELDRATAAYQTALSKYQKTIDEIAATRARVEKTKARMNRLRRNLAERARLAYERGVAGTLDVLLSSDDFGQFSDRVEFLDRMSETDAELILLTRVTQEELRRQEQQLRDLSQTQEAAADALAKQQAIIDARLSEAAAIVAKHESILEAQRAVAKLGGPVVQGQALQACPVNGPRSYWNDWGQPRSGGRTHQGTDILASQGTPVVAAQSGSLSLSSNSLGGISAYVYGSDMTYYAHLSGYAGVPSGASVSAGQVIGYVGNTGNAAGGPPHLHFEYHPGGGGAVNPYPYLVAVGC
jgi:peptidoglycan LD-endopeptidase LytH